MNSIRITAPHFCAGVEIDRNSRIIRTAPILSYMKGWTVERVTEYCDHKNWKWEVV